MSGSGVQRSILSNAFVRYTLAAVAALAIVIALQYGIRDIKVMNARQRAAESALKELYRLKNEMRGNLPTAAGSARSCSVPEGNEAAPQQARRRQSTSIKAPRPSPSAEAATGVPTAAVVFAPLADEPTEAATTPAAPDPDAPVTAAPPKGEFVCEWPCGKACFLISNCPSEYYLVNLLAQEIPDRHDWVVVDVGVNKGYVAAASIEAMGIHTDWTPKNHMTALMDFIDVRMAPHMDVKSARNIKQKQNLCGACADCHELNTPLPLDGKTPQSVQLFVFDPIAAHIDFFVNYMAPQLKQQIVTRRLNTTVVVKGEVAAVANEVGKTPFIQAPFGAETASLGNAVKSNAPVINKTTIDTVLSKEASIDFIDVLLTDTEGHDYAVADGAKNWIDTGKVGMYLFELTGADRLLGEHLERLDKAGFDCFLPTWKREWYLPLPKCTNHAQYVQLGTFSGWANAVCFNRERYPKTIEKLLATGPKAEAELRAKSQKEGKAANPVAVGPNVPQVVRRAGRRRNP